MCIIPLILTLISLFFWTKGIAEIKKHPSKEENIVILPRFNVFLGIFCSLLFLAPVVYIFLCDDTAMYILAILFIVFWFLGISLVIAYINCRIEYNDEYFTYKNFLGKTRHVEYKDLTSYRGENRDIKLFVGDVAFTVDWMSVNAQEFVSFAKRKYKKHHTFSLPKNHKKDIFNNHVENPGEFIFIFILLGVFFAVITALIIYISIPAPKDEFREISFTSDSYEIDEALLLIRDSEGVEYGISAFKDLIDESDDFLKLVEQKTTFIALARYNEKSDNPRYNVSALKIEDGEIYFTYEDWLECEKDKALAVVGIILICDLLILIFILSTIYVGRNANKLSDRVVHMFFKPGYVHRD